MSIKFENTEVVGWEAAIRGMRNPMNSWENSDSGCPFCEELKWCCIDGFDQCGKFIGPNDHNLMMKLRNAGTDHRKFMRMVVVYVDITAPLYWWKEFDTYKVGTVANSCSTMHCIHKKEFTKEDFSFDHVTDQETEDVIDITLKTLNFYRDQFLKIDDKYIKNNFPPTALDPVPPTVAEMKKQAWWQMIQLLPSSYNQKRTVMMNYEVLTNIYKSRKNHKLDEWSKGFISWIKELPYSELITGERDLED